MNPWTLPEESEPEPGDVTDTQAVKPLGKEWAALPEPWDLGQARRPGCGTSLPPVLLHREVGWDNPSGPSSSDIPGWCHSASPTHSDPLAWLSRQTRSD